MFNIFPCSSLCESLIKIQKSMRSLILNKIPPILFHRLHVDCLLNIKRIPDSQPVSLYFLVEGLYEKPIEN